MIGNGIIGETKVATVNIPCQIAAPGTSDVRRCEPIHAVLSVDVPTSGIVHRWDTDTYRSYAKALVAEIEANAVEFGDVVVDAVRLGGGCVRGALGGQASNLGGEPLGWVVDAIRRCFNVCDGAPLSLRCSPADITAAWMPCFKRCGVTRFDVEMLTLCPTSFARMNREGDLGFFPLQCNSLLHAERTGSLGLVLTVGHPRQSDVECRRSFLAAHRYGCTHVAVEVWRENDSDLRDARETGDTRDVNHQFEDGREVLVAAGFVEYAPGRFALPGREDRFEVAAASGGNIIGFGAGAVTRFEGAMSCNTPDVPTYLAFSSDFARITHSAGQSGVGQADQVV